MIKKIFIVNNATRYLRKNNIASSRMAYNYINNNSKMAKIATKFMEHNGSVKWMVDRVIGFKL